MYYRSLFTTSTPNPLHCFLLVGSNNDSNEQRLPSQERIAKLETCLSAGREAEKGFQMCAPPSPRVGAILDLEPFLTWIHFLAEGAPALETHIDIMCE